MPLQAAVAAPAAAVVDASLWSRFASAQALGPFVQAWLALQCAELEGAQAGVVLWRQDDGSFKPLAIWPNLQRDVTHLGGAARQALTERRGLFLPADGEVGPVPRVHVAYPIVLDDRPCGVAVVDLQVAGEGHLQRQMQRLHWGAGWLECRARDLVRHDLDADLGRLRAATDLIALAGEADSARAAALALVNGVVEQLPAARAMLGIERRGHIVLLALSKTAWFDARTQEVGDIENLMEEAHDQGAAMRWPVDADEPFQVRVAHEDWCRRRAGTAVASAPLVGRDGALGVITVERDDGEPVSPEQLRTLTALGLLAGPVLQDKLALQAWVAGRVPRALARWRDRLTQRGHATWKLAAAAVALVAVLLSVLHQDYRVTAKSVIEGQVQRAAVAPFEGYVATAPVRAGQTVRAGEVLATLDDRDLRLEAARWRSEYEQADQKYRDAMARRERAAMAMLSAQVRQAQAQLALVEQKLSRTAVTAPIDGLVVSGDLSQKLGSPVQMGELLFEVAPLTGYRVILQVDERDINDLRVGQSGRLVLNGWSGEPLALRVDNVTAVAEQREGRNFFRVEAQLTGRPAGLRPGMEGVGKVEVGERRVWWVWTHTLTDWLRLAWWRWLP